MTQRRGSGESVYRLSFEEIFALKRGREKNVAGGLERTLKGMDA